jgi:hypothetical protein
MGGRIRWVVLFMALVSAGIVIFRLARREKEPFIADVTKVEDIAA